MNIYELIGIIIGDGNIMYNKKHRNYWLEITGNAEEDLDYFMRIKKIIEKKSKNKVRIWIKKEKLGKGLRLRINDKKFVEYLIYKLGPPFGKKTFSIEIPKKFLIWKYSRYIIRGICESDGCIYFSKSRLIEYSTYPRIEIRTSSNKLIKQVILILKKQDFNIQLLKCGKTAKLYVSGPEMLNKWFKK